jgi:hypothetical protein
MLHEKADDILVGPVRMDDTGNELIKAFLDAGRNALLVF